MPYGDNDIIVYNGKPAIGYYNGWSDGLYKFAQAADDLGSAWQTPTVIGDAGTAAVRCSMTLIDGKPAAAYSNTNVTDYELRYAVYY